MKLGKADAVFGKHASSKDICDKLKVMKKFAIQAILLVIVIGFTLLYFSPTNQGSGDFSLPFLPQPTKFETLQINGSKLKVEIADTTSKKSKGLSGRDFLAQDEGLLFVYDKPDKYAYWMKGMKFALDFVWIKDNIVVDLLPNIPPPASGQKDSALPIYTAKVEFNKVLEVNAGVIQRLNIKAGDTIIFSP